MSQETGQKVNKKMGSRLRPRKQIKKLFECYMIVEAPWSTSSSSNGQNGHSGGSSPTTSNGHSSSSSTSNTPTIKSVYPASFNKPDVLKTAAQFAFPCQTLSETVELFTFVLTNEDSKWTFGYCRHPPGATRGKSVCVFLTFLPWQEIFYRALNYLAEVVQEDGKLLAFLERMYGTQVPEPGTCLYIPTHQKPFICPCPSDLSLPSIPENVTKKQYILYFVDIF